ncbi:MAG: GNAT family N-acetyltransferase [Polyangiaceae bacterium]
MPIDRKDRAFGEALEQWRLLAGLNGSPLLAPELSLLSVRLLPGSVPLLACAGGPHPRQASAVLPLARRGRALAALRSDHTPRVDLVGDIRALPALWRAVREAEPWDVLRLRGVPADSSLALGLPDLARDDRFRVSVVETSRQPWFDVRGIEQRIHRRFRGDMRRLERQLGGVVFERVPAFDRAALRCLFHLESAGWKGAEGTAIACDPRLVAFYSGVARVFARRRQLTLAFLHAQGKRIAACFALEDSQTFHLLKIAYDPRYAHFGPGQLLVRETARDADLRGLVHYDLHGHASPYKLKWTDRVRPHVEVTVYAPTARGRALHWTREVLRPRAGHALRAIQGGLGIAARSAAHPEDGSPVAPKRA